MSRSALLFVLIGLGAVVAFLLLNRQSQQPQGYTVNQQGVSGPGINIMLPDVVANARLTFQDWLNSLINQYGLRQCYPGTTGGMICP